MMKSQNTILRLNSHRVAEDGGGDYSNGYKDEILPENLMNLKREALFA